MMEKNWTLDMVKRVENLLSKYEGVSILVTRASDKYVSINDRIANARKADYFFSFRNNAGKGKGFESYISVDASRESKRIQSIITNDVLALLENYGVGGHSDPTKTDNQAAKGRIGVVTYTHMPAILFENLFIENRSENNLLKSEDFKGKLSQVYASSIAKCLELKAKTVKPSVPKFTRYLKLKKPMMYGNDVRAVQAKVGVKVDGWYGPITVRAVKNWQLIHDGSGRVVSAGRGLQVDGIVSSITFAAMFGKNRGNEN